VADGEAWGALWREHQNRYFREHGLDIQVDPTAAHAGQHLGPVRMRRAGADIVEQSERIRAANEAAARDPEQVLAALTRHNATFTERDVDRYLGKHITDDAERLRSRQRCLDAGMSLPCTTATRAKRPGASPRVKCAQEQAALADAAGLAKANLAAVPSDIAAR
jgi:hypothetical protein